MHANGLLKGIKEYSEHSTYFADFYRFFDKVANSGGVKKPKVIMITSASEGEGKTTLSSYLMITAAISTQNYYLLVDGDLRRPMVHKRFGVPREYGLTDVLTGHKDLHQVIKRSPFQGLHLITAGSMAENPFQVLSQSSCGGIFNRLRSYYNMIVIDAPPIVPVSDTFKLAQYADGIVLAVMAGKTSRVVVKRAIDLIHETHRPLLGVTLNDVVEVLPYYYQRKYYRYPHRSKEAGSSNKAKRK